jgi:hypothetical protein
MNDYQQNGYQNGYQDEKRHLDEDAFGAKAGNIVSAFDAFRKSSREPPSIS